MKVEISQHAKRRLVIRGISENLILDTLRNPDKTLFDEETGYFIAAKKVNDKLLIVAFQLSGDVVRVISTFLTSKLDMIDRRIKSKRWKLI